MKRPTAGISSAKKRTPEKRTPEKRTPEKHSVDVDDILSVRLLTQNYTCNVLVPRLSHPLAPLPDGVWRVWCFTCACCVCVVASQPHSSQSRCLETIAWQIGWRWRWRWSDCGCMCHTFRPVFCRRSCEFSKRPSKVSQMSQPRLNDQSSGAVSHRP
jgi:hypothetical protein